MDTFKQLHCRAAAQPRSLDPMCRCQPEVAKPWSCNITSMHHGNTNSDENAAGGSSTASASSPHTTADISAHMCHTRHTACAAMFPHRFAGPSPTQALSCCKAIPLTQQQQHARLLCTVANLNSTRLQDNTATSYHQIRPDTLISPTSHIKKLHMHFKVVLRLSYIYIYLLQLPQPIVPIVLIVDIWT